MAYHALSVDVEDWYHATALEPGLGRRPIVTPEPRVVAATIRLLEILGDGNATATFFMLGCVAERFPDLARRIMDGGHELASHGYTHEPLTRQTPERFRAELTRAVRLCEDLTGQPLRGYRAPSQSLVPQTCWALDILIDLGFRYDSSTRASRGESLSRAYRIDRPDGKQILEFPFSTVRLPGFRQPVAGGGYFRIMPYPLTRHFVRRFDDAGLPANVYLHPWEIDPDQPRIAGIGCVSRVRHYAGLRTVEGKLRRLLKEFRFAPIGEILKPSHGG